MPCLNSIQFNCGIELESFQLATEKKCSPGKKRRQSSRKYSTCILHVAITTLRVFHNEIGVIFEKRHSFDFKWKINLTFREVVSWEGSIGHHSRIIPSYKMIIASESLFNSWFHKLWGFKFHSKIQNWAQLFVLILDPR